MDTDVPATELATFCPNCGRPYAQEDRFCATCGRSRNVPATLARKGVTPLALASSKPVPIPASGSDAAGTPIPVLPLGIRPVLIAAAVTYAATVVLSVALSAILVFAAASALSLALGSSSAGPSPASGQGAGQLSLSDIGIALQGLLTFVSYTFLAGHFGPLEASGLGGGTYSIIGVGSLTIAGVALLVSFAMARRIERNVPTHNAGSAFIRGTVLAIPYGLGALALYIPSVVTIGPQQFGVSIHASLLGVFLAAAVAGLGGGLGAASIRIVRGAAARSVIRGAARATAAIALGAILTAVVAAVWIGIGAVTQSSAPTSTTLSSPLAGAQQLGWSLAALIPFYFFNAIALIWSATLDGSLFSGSPLHLLIYLGPLAGALLGAVKLRGNVDRVEQASYAGSFAAATGVIAFATTPGIVNGPALLPNPWTGVLIALVFAAATALAAPYLLAVAPVRAFASGPLTWVMKPVLGLWPAETIDRTPLGASSEAITMPRPRPREAASRAITLLRLRLGRIYPLLAVVLVILVVGGLVASSQLSARFSPEAVALSYLGAQGRGDVDAMWALMTFEAATPSTSSQFLTKDALKAMLTSTDNRDITNVSVADSSHENDANYTITVHVTKAGQPKTTQLRIRKDPSRANWLVYPSWHVVIVPSVIQVTTYQHAGGVTVDGIDAAISAPAGSVAVIPGVHRIQLAPTDIFAGDTKQIDASTDTSAAFDTQLALPAFAALTNVVGAFFDHCAEAQKLRPAGCPNAASPRADHQSRISWTLAGDPSANMKLSSAIAVDSVITTGTWQMHVSFDYWWNLGHRLVQHWDQDTTGNFTDTLKWNGSSFDITSQTGATTARTQGTSSVPKPSITATVAGAYNWQVVGQYFMPGEGIRLYLYDPYNPLTWAGTYAPGISVRSDGSFTVSTFEMTGVERPRPGTAMIKVCDDANLCATVLIAVP